eukprot:7947734-Alexandrium_andersonii.AAC.1
MSASLVGSEMCIRDRSGGGGRGGGRHRGAAGKWATRNRRGAVPEQQRPVSYTHLTLPTICSV